MSKYENNSLIIKNGKKVPTTLDKSITIMRVLLERITDTFGLSVESYRIKNQEESMGWIYVQNQTNPYGVSVKFILDLKAKTLSLNVTHRRFDVLKLDPLFDKTSDFFKTFGVALCEVFPGCEEKLVKFALIVFIFLTGDEEFMRNLVHLIKLCDVNIHKAEIDWPKEDKGEEDDFDVD